MRRNTKTPNLALCGRIIRGLSTRNRAWRKFMKIGLFDHLERSPDRALSTQFDERLEFVAAADAVLIALLLVFPQIALWLPGILFP